MRSFAVLVALGSIASGHFTDAVAAGSRAPCHVRVESSEIAELVQRYAPTGANGRASAAAVYRIGANGQVEQVLYEKSASIAQAVASTQKIISAWTAFRMGDLSRETAFTQDDLYHDSFGHRAIHPGTRRQVLVGERLNLGEYLTTMMLQSSNGAAQALARGSAGSVSAFVAKMNSEVRFLLGPEAQSYFQNPSGLTDSSQNFRFAADNRRQQSTASELARLAGRLMTDTAFRRALQSARVPSSGSGYMYKLGYTQAAGRTAVVTIPLSGRCSSQVIAYAIFGSLASDQFSRFKGFYDSVRELVAARH